MFTLALHLQYGSLSSSSPPHPPPTKFSPMGKKVRKAKKKFSTSAKSIFNTPIDWTWGVPIAQ